MAENLVYETFDSNIKNQTRIIMIAAFSGADAIAGLTEPHQRKIATATKIAMTALNIEQHYPDQFPPPALAPMTNSIFREIKIWRQETEVTEPVIIAKRMVASYELQNLAGEIICLANKKRQVFGGIGKIDPIVQQMATHANIDHNYRQKLKHQADGYYERLPQNYARQIQKEIRLCSHLTQSQVKVLDQLGAMTPDQVDQVFRLAQTDLLGIATAGKQMVDSTHDPRLHQGKLGQNTGELNRLINAYLGNPTGLCAYELMAKATDQADKMEAIGIDIRVRQAFNLSIKAVSLQQEIHIKEVPERGKNVTKLHITHS